MEKNNSLSELVKPVADNLDAELKKLLFKVEYGAETKNIKNIKLNDNILDDISAWKKRHLVKSDELLLHGYETWYLEILIREYRFYDKCSFKEFLLMLFLSETKESDIELAGESVKGGHYNDFWDQVWFPSLVRLDNDSVFYHISHSEFIDDLVHYHNGSKDGFEAWKVDYNIHTNAKPPNCEKLFDYAEFYKSLEDYEFVRLNKLGNEDILYQVSWYFAIGNETVHVVILSDISLR